MKNLSKEEFLEKWGGVRFLFKESYKGVYTYQPFPEGNGPLFCVRVEYRDTFSTYESPNAWEAGEDFMWNSGEGWCHDED
jgi:hypothetical protein